MAYMNEILRDSCFSDIHYFDNEVNLDASRVTVCSANLMRYSASVLHGKQQGVCILMSRGAYYIAAIFSAWRAGFYVVPLNTAWPLQKNIDIIRRIKPAVVLIDDDAAILDIDYPCLKTTDLFALSNSLVRQEIDISPPISLKPSDIAYVIFTSGSTGEPKGVVISAGSYRSYIDWTRRFFTDYAESQRLLLTSELTFDITMGDIAFALAFGTDIGVAQHNTNIPSVLAMIMRHKIDVLYSVPTTHLALTAFAKQKRGADISTLQLVLSGGDRFPWQLVRDYVKLTNGAHFYNVYGPTEATINCFSVRLDNKFDLEAQDKPVPIGQCFDSLDYVLLDEGNNPSKEGELCVTGPQLMLGYHNDQERTSMVFTKDPRLPFAPRMLYRTGDIGYEMDGLMFLKGRIDGLVKIRGYRIHPDEVSRAIDRIEGVDVSAVVPFGPQSEAVLVAFIRLRNKAEKLNEDAISKKLKEILPTYMIPNRYLFIDNFPLNQSGKINKKALMERL